MISTIQSPEQFLQFHTSHSFSLQIEHVSVKFSVKAPLHLWPTTVETAPVSDAE